MAGVILYYLVAYVFVAVFCLAVQVPVSFDIRAIEYQDLLSPVSECTRIDTVKVMILPVISSMAAVSVQLAAALVTSAFMGFLFMAVLYISSAYYCTPFLTGNFSMLARSSIFRSDGIDAMQAVLISIMDLPQAGHHGKEVGNVYSIKKCDQKNQTGYSAGSHIP